MLCNALLFFIRSHFLCAPTFHELQLFLRSLLLFTATFWTPAVMHSRISGAPTFHVLQSFMRSHSVYDPVFHERSCVFDYKRSLFSCAPSFVNCKCLDTYFSCAPVFFALLLFMSYCYFNNFLRSFSLCAPIFSAYTSSGRIKSAKLFTKNTKVVLATGLRSSLHRNTRDAREHTSKQL